MLLRALEGEYQPHILYPDGTVEFFAADYAGVVEYLQEKMLSYQTPQLNPPLGVPAKQLRHFPSPPIPPFWPLMAIAELEPEMGEPETISDTDVLIRAIRLGLFIYHPSLWSKNKAKLGEKEEFEDGRMQAHRLTRAVWGNWLKAFQSDHALRDQLNRIEVRVEVGDRDRVGFHYYQDDNRTTILWLRVTTIEFYL